MVFEFSLFGFQLFSMSLFKVEAISEEEHIHNTDGVFERATVPFGFAAGDYDEEEDE